MRDGVVRLCAGADLVIYDTMFTPEDYLRIPHYGHSRPADAVDVCRQADARAAGAVSPRARAHRRGDRRHPRPRPGRPRPRADGKLTVMAAYEGLDLELGRS